MNNKVIITAAVTGAIHVPTMSPYLPITPDQIIDEAVKSYEAGAAVVHIHARDPQDGRPSADLGLYREILEGIKKRCNVVICVTTGGGLGMSLEERIAAVREFKPELASFNMGSINFALYPLAQKIEKFNYSWEKDYLEFTEDFAFSNTFKALKYFCQTMNEHGTVPELEVYDVGMINNISQIIEEGIMKTPVYTQFVMGILGGIPADADNLLFLYNTAKKLLSTFNWSVCAAGRNQFPMGVTGMALGGNIRVGLEDSIYISRGVLAKSNAEQVAKAGRIAKELGLETATPDDARQILGLKGLDYVSF